MGKIIDFNEYLDKMKKIFFTRNENQINIRGYKGKITVYLDVQCREKKDRCFLINVIRKISGKSVQDTTEISEEECKLTFIKYFKQISYEVEDMLYESLWEQLRVELLKSSNFQYSVIIGDFEKNRNAATYISSKVFSMRKKQITKNKR